MLAGVDAAVNALNDARLNAIAETKGRAARLAQRLVSDRRGTRARLLTGRVLSVSMAAVLVGYLGMQHGGVGYALGAVALLA